MMHRQRIWSLSREVFSPDDLAEKLSEYSWTTCAGFRSAGGAVWVNDSTCSDALQEYAVLRWLEGAWRQVESITVSWCDVGKLETYAREADSGAWDSERYGEVSGSQLQDPGMHQTCGACA